MGARMFHPTAINTERGLCDEGAGCSPTVFKLLYTEFTENAEGTEKKKKEEADLKVAFTAPTHTASLGSRWPWCAR